VPLPVRRVFTGGYWLRGSLFPLRCTGTFLVTALGWRDVDSNVLGVMHFFVHEETIAFYLTGDFREPWQSLDVLLRSAKWVS